MQFCGKIAATICAMILCGCAVWGSLPACDNPVLWYLMGIGACVVLLFLFRLGRRQFVRGGKRIGLCVMAIALILSAVGTAFVFQNKPAALMGKPEVTITCGEKSEASKGYEVWITGCKVNGVKQPIQSVTVLNRENVNLTEEQTAWLYANADGTGKGQITFEFDASAGARELVLVKHAWSGVIEVKTNNGAEPFSVDLYSETGGQYELEIPEGPMKPVWFAVLLFAGYALILMAVLFPLLYMVWRIAATAWNKVMSIVGKTKEGKIFSANSADLLLMGVAAAAIPFHYLLFLFTNNSGEIIFSSLISLALTVSALALVAYAVMYTATRHPLSAFAAGAMVSVLMFVTGYADDIVRANCSNESTTVMTLCIVGGACALLLLPLLWLRHKKVSEVRLSTILISIVSVLLLVFNVPKALDINRQQQENMGLQYIKTDFNIDSTVTDRPNVYWLHCDSMLGFDAYEKYFGDNQAEFEQNLQARGFAVNRSAMFEGGHTTTVCLPSLTCPDFYDEYVTPRIVDGHLETWMGHPDGIALQSVASTMRANLEITSAFRSIGYTVALNTANWSGGIYFADADEKYESPDGIVITRSIDQRTGGIRTANAGGTENFTEAFIRPLRWAMDKIKSITEAPEIVARVNGEKVNRAAGATLSVVYADPLIAPGDGKERFVFIVFNDAHTPFDINENGEWITEGNTNPLDYEPAHRFSQKVVLTMIDSIVAKDPNAVIIIQADHGLHGNTREDFVTAFGEDAQEKELWNCVISAIRVPEQYQNGEESYAAGNPLNMSRYLVNRFVGKNYEYLPANEPLEP